MDSLTTVFQFEIRYNHILNFSQIARKMLSPYVRLAQKISFEKQNTVEERIIFNFDDDDYLIIVSWDRILIKGQENLNTYLADNSPMETPFFNILNQISELEEFGTIQNVLFVVNNIKQLDIAEDQLMGRFIDTNLQNGVSKILDKNTDIAITLENKQKGEEMSISFGPYFGSAELLRRPLVPVNISNLGDTDYSGVMVEYKHFRLTSEASFLDFKQMVKTSNEIIEKVWEKT